MAAKYVNQTNVPLAISVWLATDNYDLQEVPENTISVTTLLKPIKQIILSQRVTVEQGVVEISSKLKSAMGSALHDSMERAWLNPKEALKSLGYPAGVIKAIKVNPDPDTVTEDDIPVYIEQRESIVIAGVNVSGKFDTVFDGQVEDYKSTSTFMYMSQTNSDKHIKQGSLYKLLNPKKITADTMAINYLFTDWSAAKAKADPKYPQCAVTQQVFELMPVEQTRKFAEHKIMEIKRLQDAPESELPDCTDEELWRSEDVFKYYSKPDALRASKNFTSPVEARLYLQEKGGKGEIRLVKGKARACNYCAAAIICNQRAALLEADELA